MNTHKSILFHVEIRILLTALLCLLMSGDVFAQHYPAIGSQLGGSNDALAFLGFLIFVCPIVWLFLRYYLNRLGSYFYGICKPGPLAFFLRDNLGETGATIGVIICIILVLML